MSLTTEIKDIYNKIVKSMLIQLDAIFDTNLSKKLIVSDDVTSRIKKIEEKAISKLKRKNKK